LPQLRQIFRIYEFENRVYRSAPILQLLCRNIKCADDIDATRVGDLRECWRLPHSTNVLDNIQNLEHRSRLQNKKNAAGEPAAYDLSILQGYVCIDARNSALVFVLPRRSRTTSICSTGDSGLSTRRITQIRLRSSFSIRSSSLRVPDR